MQINTHNRKGECMPNNKIHSENTKGLYGVEASDLHRWMDAPVTIVGTKHRKYRHDTSVLDNIPIKFINKYGKTTCTDIILDHLVLDNVLTKPCLLYTSPSPRDRS